MNPAATIHIARPVPSPTPSSWRANARVVGASVMREAIAQPPAKLAGLAAVCASVATWSTGDEAIVTASVVGVTAVAGLLVTSRLASHCFGTGTFTAKAATALSGAVGAAVGTAFAVGNEATVAGVESGVAVAAIGLWAAHLHAHRKREEVSVSVNAVIALSSVTAAIAVWGAMGLSIPRAISESHRGGAADGFLIARGAGALVEAMGVELGKEVLGGLGPAADRKGLTFDDRIKAALKVFVPYVVGCAAINGYLAPPLAESGDGVGPGMSFTAMLAPVLVTCLTNMLRNGMSAAAVLHTWPEGHREGVPANPHDHEVASKTWLDHGRAVGDRWAIRTMLMAARTSTYVFLRMHGFSITESAMAAQAKYAAFNNFRETLSDVMAGEGPSPEVLARLRATDPPLVQIDLVDIEAQFDAEEVEREFQRVLEESKRAA